MGNLGIGWWIDDFLDSSQRSWNFTGLWCWYGRPRETKTERRINYHGPLVSKLRIHSRPRILLEGKKRTHFRPISLGFILTWWKAPLLIYLWQNRRQGAARNYGYLKNILVSVSEKCQIQPTTYKINTTQQLYKLRKSHYCVLARQHVYEFVSKARIYFTFTSTFEWPKGSIPNQFGIEILFLLLYMLSLFQFFFLIVLSFWPYD
jgi:hypothetical protein